MAPLTSPVLIHQRDLYQNVWNGIATYGDYSPGAQDAALFAGMAEAANLWDAGTVLDAGCGSGKGGLALEKLGFDVTLCDLTPDGLTEEARQFPFREACLWDDLDEQVGRFDWVYCCDVLEHIPPALTMLCVQRMLAIARRGVFLAISTVPDANGAAVGEALHKTVRDYVWWRDHLQCVGCLVESRDLLTFGVFLLNGEGAEPC